MAIEILLRVTRDAGDRLYGSAQLAGGAASPGDGDSREFSGMLELMSVFDDLIPPDHEGPPRAV